MNALYPVRAAWLNRSSALRLDSHTVRYHRGVPVTDLFPQRRTMESMAIGYSLGTDTGIVLGSRSAPRLD